MESELSGDQHQLLRAFDELAEGSTATDVTASDAAQKAGLEPDTPEFEAVLGYLVDVGHKRGAEETAALDYPVPHQCRSASAVACCVFAFSRASRRFPRER
jgi:hypothetical protein